MIDFDKLFQKYVSNWYATNKDKFKNATEMENYALEIYSKWLDEDNIQLGGVSPNAYFNDFSAQQLVQMLIDYGKKNMQIPDILCDKIVDRQGVEQYLVDILKDSRQSNEVKMLCANMLNEKQSEIAFDIYVDWIMSDNIGEDLKEIACEILTEYTDNVRQKLIDRISEANTDSKKLIADILVHSQPDERIYNLLVELFTSEDDIALYGAYLGSYGDKRALEVLHRFVKRSDINYVQWCEIKNSIERLGGEIEEVERNFENDEYYKALKGIK